MSTLEGTVAVVTGGGRGIGRSIAEELSGGGARIVVNYARSKEAAEELCAGLSENAEAVALQADVSDPDQASSLIEGAVERFGRIDLLVNNAGINVDKTLKKLSVEDWDSVVHTNLDSCFYTVKAALPHFTGQGYGKIVNISSFVGQAGNIGQTNYAAAKAGIIGFTKSAARELAKENITVNAVCPGFVETDMFANVPEKIQEQILSSIPLGRLGSPQEVARAVLYLVTDGGYMTGQTIDINGGVYI